MSKCKYFYLCALLLGLTISPAAADWLVTHDGSRIETLGPWTVDGRSVVFTQPNGTLSSLRASRVDFDASTVASSSPPRTETVRAVARMEREEPVMVITDRDVAEYRPPVEPAAETAQERPRDENTAPSNLVVHSWEQVRDPHNTNSVEIVGTVLNKGEGLATNLKVVVLLYDEEDVLMGATNASLPVKAIPPHKATKFRAVFPDLVTFAYPRFETRSHNVKFVPLNFDLSSSE